MDIPQLIHQYGYAAVGVGAFLEGETVLILAAVSAHLGYLKLQRMAEKSLFSLFQTLARSGRREEALRVHDLFQAAYPRSFFPSGSLPESHPV